ncbi:hypothetical protein AMAG_18843 [Allomyces macrogynus ATCC 38327]|uniref:Katanin p80 WD40 repeat-containing subunit B1 homolog n=1 Tax=Allomyces macrogynus (strain ATCC 38327) TaxID=578462 RepID=A0A0L0SIM4_ALLM3|nr:hypothetical protein AMAG_18843 [Allomyces macrogynus ATCC 38327]|eukprot:KNE62299.1 hypothetical protein AMAG_18843 [Allomyces macrogynus ATCC 38327]
MVGYATPRSRLSHDPAATAAAAAIASPSAATAISRRRSMRGRVSRGHEPLAAQLQPQALAANIGRTPEEISASYEQWMKLAADNKINVANSWTLGLIDYFADMTILREHGTINFQKASCTLDGCVKIYTTRVDSVATETEKLVSGLNDSKQSASASRAARNRNSDDDDDEDGDGTHEPEGEVVERRKRTRKANTKTLEKDLNSITTKKYDLEFMVDPLFRKTCAEFDEGGAKALLFNRLDVFGEGLIAFDASDMRIDEDAGAAVAGEEEAEDRMDVDGEEGDGAAMVDISSWSNVFRCTPQDLQAKTICPSLDQFVFTDDVRNYESLMQNLQLDLLDDKELEEDVVVAPTGATDDYVPIQMPALEYDYDDYDDDGAGMGGIDFPSDSDRPAGAVDGELGADDAVPADTDVDAGAEPPHVDQGLDQLLLLPVPRASSDPVLAAANKPARAARTARPRPEPVYFDFATMEPVNVETLFYPGGASINLPRTTEDRPAHKHQIVVKDVFNPAHLARLFIKPHFTLAPPAHVQQARTRRSVRGSAGGGDPIDVYGAGPAGEFAAMMAALTAPPDRPLEAPVEEEEEEEGRAVNEAADAAGAAEFGFEAPVADAMDDDDDDEDMVGFVPADEMPVLPMPADLPTVDYPAYPPPPPMPMVDDDDFPMPPPLPQDPPVPGPFDIVPPPASTQTAAAPMPSTSAIRQRLVLNYAKRAKRVDVKRLKETMWRKIRSRHSLARANAARAHPAAAAAEVPQQQDDAQTNAALHLKSVVAALADDYSADKIKDISVPFCFICLLHLANEKNLRLESAVAMDDVVVLPGDEVGPDEFAAHASAVTCMRVGQKNGNILVTGGEDRRVHLWAIGHADPILALIGHTTPVQCVAIDQPEQLVVAGSTSGTLKLWDLQQGKAIRTLMGHRAAVTAVEFHPFGDFFASASADHLVKIWDVKRKGCILTFHHANVDVLRFSPDGKWILTSASAGPPDVRLWDLNGGRLVHQFAHDAPVVQITFHPRELVMATVTATGVMSFWDMDTFQRISCTSGVPPDAPLVPGTRMVFSEDGAVALALAPGHVTVWEWEPVRLVDAVAVPYLTGIDDAVLSPSGTHLVVVAHVDSFVQVFQLNVAHLRPFRSLAASASASSATAGSPGLASSTGSALSMETARSNSFSQLPPLPPISPPAAAAHAAYLGSRPTTSSQQDSAVIVGGAGGVPLAAAVGGHAGLPVTASFSSLDQTIKPTIVPTAMRASAAPSPLGRRDQPRAAERGAVAAPPVDDQEPAVGAAPVAPADPPRPVVTSPAPATAAPTTFPTSASAPLPLPAGSVPGLTTAGAPQISAELMSLLSAAMARDARRQPALASGTAVPAQSAPVVSTNAAGAATQGGVASPKPKRADTPSPPARGVLRVEVATSPVGAGGPASAGTQVTPSLAGPPSLEDAAVGQSPSQLAPPTAPSSIAQPATTPSNNNNPFIATCGTAPLYLDLTSFARGITAITSGDVISPTGTGVLAPEQLSAAHGAVSGMLSQRLRHLRHVRARWTTSGRPMPALEYAAHVASPAVYVDVLKALRMQPRVYSLDVCVKVLPWVAELMFQPYEDYLMVACTTVKLVLTNFAQLILDTLSAFPARGAGLDLTREERADKCRRCKAELLQIKQICHELASAPGQAGATIRDTLAAFPVGLV